MYRGPGFGQNLKNKLLETSLTNRGVKFREENKSTNKYPAKMIGLFFLSLFSQTKK